MTIVAKSLSQLADEHMAKAHRRIIARRTGQKINNGVRHIDAQPLAMKRTEHGEQCAVIDWCRLMEGRWPELVWIHASANGGKRSIKTGADLKASGVLAGVCDLFLPCPRGEYHGLFIEMKIKPNRPTADQVRFIDAMNAAGYAAWVCFSSDEAIDVIENYLGAR